MFKYILIIIFSAITIQAQSVMFMGNASHSGVIDTNPLRSSIERKFTFHTKGAVRSTPAISGNVIYIGSTDGYFYAINKNDGTEIWKFKTGGSVTSSPAAVNNIVIFSSRDRNIYALNKDNGKLVWKYETGKDIELHWGFDIYLSSPLVVENEIYIGGGDGNLYKLSFDGKLVWKYNVPYRIRTTPAYKDGVVFFGDCDGTFYAVNTGTGKLKWKYDTQGKNIDPAEFGTDRKSIISSPAIADGKVIFGARDGFFYALDEETGKFLWNRDYDVSWVIGSPAVENGRIYIGTSDGRFFHCLNLSNGEELWRINTKTIVWSSASIVKDMVYFGDGNGNIFGVKKESGDIVFRYRVGGAVFSSPVVDDAAVYFGCDNGDLFALTGSSEKETKIEFAKGVFYDKDVMTIYFAQYVQEEMKNYFVKDGYELLDKEKIKSFLQAAIDSNKNSVIVFITTTYPGSIFNYSAGTDLLREYLNAGNSIVMLTRNPVGFVYDTEADTLIDINFNRAEKYFGISFTGNSYVEAMGGRYQSYPTGTGKKMGLTGGFISSFGIDPKLADKVLAVDEYGKATSWIKSYTKNKYRGLIQLWLPNEGANDPSFIKNTAEYGFYH